MKLRGLKTYITRLREKRAPPDINLQKTEQCLRLMETIERKHDELSPGIAERKNPSGINPLHRDLQKLLDQVAPFCRDFQKWLDPQQLESLQTLEEQFRTDPQKSTLAQTWEVAMQVIKVGKPMLIDLVKTHGQISYFENPFFRKFLTPQEQRFLSVFENSHSK